MFYKQILEQMIIKDIYLRPKYDEVYKSESHIVELYMYHISILYRFTSIMEKKDVPRTTLWRLMYGGVNESQSHSYI